jgi:hypothetical protein
MADPSQEEEAAAESVEMEDCLHGVRLDITRMPSGQLFSANPS